MKREKMNLFKEKTSIKNLVVKNNNFISVYLNCKAGEGLPNHTHEKMAQLVVLEGKFKIEFEDGGRYELSKGELLSFDSNVIHNVVALEESKALVTFGV
ncbi:cupin domain-containing protein [Clostridium sardiniense]|uniref:Cupin domain-containing protein n=1 Tax=Clostridium sardiniense TaxID=29369 RepID=A0ABS7L309_CLOSR|nr:cupin domain-containing protein [Clostridium sardiniense]MBY0757460.1 cupin domain-containing protein [Clostridium sardiniense]MDQ0462036.1 quercetin dioxygenase-like cupin family protein [Clostridium sardiniense]